MIIDLRQFAFATLWKKYEKKLNNDKTKQAIREKDYTTKFNDYGKVVTDKYTKTIYKKDGEIIKLNTTEIIEEYCAVKGIEIVKETLEDYTVEIVPSEKAKTEFNKMIAELENSQYRNIAKVASKVANKI